MSSVSLVTDALGFEDPAQDEAYRALFRPAEPTPELPSEPEAMAALEPLQAPADNAGTGRLFRSRGAEASSDTLVALSASDAAQLRTMSLQPQDEVAAVPQVAMAAPAAMPIVALPQGENPEEWADVAQRKRQEPGLKPSAVYVIVIGVTLLAGLIDSKVSGAGLGWLTGIALLLSSVYCATRVRVSEVSVSVIAPPIAFGLAAVTVGQLGQSRAGGALLAWLNNSFVTLADNWFWVIGTTLVCLAIAVVRSRR